MTESEGKVSQLLREDSFCLNSPDMHMSVGEMLKTGKRQKMCMEGLNGASSEH